MNKSIALSSIRFLSGSLAGSGFPLNKPVITVGHDPANDIVIKDDRTVAGFHARLLWKDGRWSIEKHPLAGAVTVNAQSIQQPTDLSVGAIIGLGENTSFLLIGSDERSPQQVTDERTHILSTQSQAVRSPSSAPPSMRRLTGPILRPDATLIAPLSTSSIPSLEVSSNNYQEKQAFALDKQVITIGRDATNDIVINDRTVSGQHVQIVRQGSELILVHPHPARNHPAQGLVHPGISNHSAGPLGVGCDRIITRSAQRQNRRRHALR